MFSAIRSAVPARAFARSFSTTQAARDVAKVTLIGRLGTDPVLKTTSTEKPYYFYAVATNGPPGKDSEGNTTPAHTSWHYVFAFNPNTHANLARLGKGSLVYVEADLEMRKSEGGPDRAFLKQQLIRTISYVKPEEESGEAPEAESS